MINIPFGVNNTQTAAARLSVIQTDRRGKGQETRTRGAEDE